LVESPYLLRLILFLLTNLSVEHSLQAGYIPIMKSMAESEDGTLLDVNADVAAAGLARALHPQPLKVVYLSQKRGLFDGAGNRISHINLDAEYDHIMSQPWCKYGTRLKIKECKKP
jgi:acetylglutamate kinase